MNERADHAEVVFACAHGNAKSLIASSWFNRLAGERGIATRSVARGLTPENPVPAAIAERLRREGIEVGGFEARPLTPTDLHCRSRLVLILEEGGAASHPPEPPAFASGVNPAAHAVRIGVEASPWASRDGLEVETWEGIPPASENYEASRDALRTRIETLLDGLAKGEPRR